MSNNKSLLDHLTEATGFNRSFVESDILPVIHQHFLPGSDLLAEFDEVKADNARLAEANAELTRTAAAWKGQFLDSLHKSSKAAAKQAERAQRQQAKRSKKYDKLINKLIKIVESAGYRVE